MYYAYFDETGDSGINNSPIQTFALGAILIHDRNWLSALDQTVSFRRYLRDNFHISPRAELKASWLVHNKGDVKKAGLSNHCPTGGDREAGTQVDPSPCSRRGRDHITNSPQRGERASRPRHVHSAIESRHGEGRDRVPPGHQEHAARDSVSTQA